MTYQICLGSRSHKDPTLSKPVNSEVLSYTIKIRITIRGKMSKHYFNQYLYKCQCHLVTKVLSI